MRGVLDVCAIRAPGFGERRKAYLEDIAILTGATYMAEEVGLTLENISIDKLGKANRVVVAKEACTIISEESNQEAVTKRIDLIRRQIENTDSEFDKEKGEERIARLGGAIGRIKVGAATETELKDKKLRYEDALNSVKSAMNDGIVPGGGSTLVYLLRTKEKLQAMIEDEDEKLAVDILYRAMTYPIIQIAENAGSEGALVLEKVKDQKFGWGWNAATGEYE